MKIFKNTKLFSNILWCCVTATICSIDIYWLFVDWNTHHLISLILFGASLIATVTNLLHNNKNK